MVSIKHPNVSLLLGVTYMAAGVLILVAGVNSAFTTPWPKGALYLILVLTSWWAFKEGLQKTRTVFRHRTRPRT
ncbi:hypothetical protein J2Y69_003505 [Microbacterium resistens]|uniref:Uncharacterized protein n=1 Tax=Microbacterium resistens TaxID=156977 RepID=A0ABU1SH57_9MICO|nr:hypothetical protein [Microbacterium resistens]MDR6868879.1 hypothetical protein [Microbacterium resistens]